MRRLLLGAVGPVVSALIVVGCGSGAPTAPARAPDLATGFGAIVASVGSSTTSFAGCLAGTAAASCFNAPTSYARHAVGANATDPAVPLNLVASSVGDAVTLRWTAPSAGGAPAAYIIEAGSASGLANLANFSTGSNLTVFQASGVGAGTYYVRIRAVTAAGPSAASNEAVLTVTGSGPCIAPGAPSGLTLTYNAGGVVTFVWNPASGAPTTYIVEAGSLPGLSNLANSDLGSPAATLTATGVGAGTYHVRVKAKNGCGTSGPSNEVILVVAGGGGSGIVRVVYAVPPDRRVRADYSGAVRNAMADLQVWYRQQLGGHTFSLFTSEPEVCALSQPSTYYPGGTYSKLLRDVQRCAAISAGTSTAWVIYADVEDACRDPGRLGVGSPGLTLLGSGDLQGLIGAPVFDSCGTQFRFGIGRYIGGAGHELGHAFGLSHPPGCDAGLATCDRNALMWSGYSFYPNTYLRPDEKQILLASPFIR